MTPKVSLDLIVIWVQVAYQPVEFGYAICTFKFVLLVMTICVLNCRTVQASPTNSLREFCGLLPINRNILWEHFTPNHVRQMSPFAHYAG